VLGLAAFTDAHATLICFSVSAYVFTAGYATKKLLGRASEQNTCSSWSTAHAEYCKCEVRRRAAKSLSGEPMSGRASVRPAVPFTDSVAEKFLNPPERTLVGMVSEQLLCDAAAAARTEICRWYLGVTQRQIRDGVHKTVASGLRCENERERADDEQDGAEVGHAPPPTRGASVRPCMNRAVAAAANCTKTFPQKPPPARVRRGNTHNGDVHVMAHARTHQVLVVHVRRVGRLAQPNGQWSETHSHERSPYRGARHARV
jgi:hypothetical protein